MRGMKFLTIFAVVVAAPAFATDFHLVCVGNATRHGQDEVSVEIIEKIGRIRLPRNILPMLHGGKDGWFRLAGIKQEENAITAKASVSLVKSLEVRINRVSGTISIDGSGRSFDGLCQPYNLATQKRAF